MIFYFRVDGANPITAITKNINVDEEGPPVDFCFRETGSNPLIVYATAYGAIVGLDLRCNTPAFRLENDLHEGLQTSIAMSSDQCWMVNGTSSGVISCWDLRFQLPIGKKMTNHCTSFDFLLQFFKKWPFFSQMYASS